MANQSSILHPLDQRPFSLVEPERKDVLLRREDKFISRLYKEGYKGSGYVFRRDGVL